MRRRAKTIVHINQHVIKQNVLEGTFAPVITVKRGAENRYAHTAIIRDEAGREVARVVYSPDKPLHCGARVWLEVPPELTVETQLRKRRRKKCLAPGCRRKEKARGYCSDHYGEAAAAVAVCPAPPAFASVRER